MSDKKRGDKETSKVDAFVESINEEIRSENWQLRWEKYGKFVTYGIAAIVLGVWTYSSWQGRDLKEREAISYRYSVLQGEIANGKMENALPQLRGLAGESKKGYAVLARLELAAALREGGNKEAIAQYKAVAEDKKADDALRELAYIFYVNCCLDMMADEELKPMLSGFVETLSKQYVGGTWDLLAKEALAFCYIKQDKKNEAKEALVQLAKTTGVPAGMAERARALINYMDE